MSTAKYADFLVHRAKTRSASNDSLTRMKNCKYFHTVQCLFIDIFFIIIEVRVGYLWCDPHTHSEYSQLQSFCDIYYGLPSLVLCSGHHFVYWCLSKIKLIWLLCIFTMLLQLFCCTEISVYESYDWMASLCPYSVTVNFQYCKSFAKFQFDMW